MLLALFLAFALPQSALAQENNAVIAGKIVDDRGEPMPQIVVHALRLVSDSPADGATTAQMVMTNEHGEYRLANLPEGSYLIIAAPPPRPPFSQPETEAGRLVPAATYYPGTANKETAQTINLAPGQTIEAVQFPMVSVQAYHVSGVVVDEAGAAVNGAMLTLVLDLRSGGTGAALMGRSDEHGMFEIKGVVSGSYQLFVAMPAFPNAPPAGAGSGTVVVQGGVFVGSTAGGPGVPAPPVTMMPGGGIMTVGGMLTSPAIEVAVNDADVSGVRVVVPARR